jgi:RNA polymerase sigma factor (sigma-70 family)
MGSPGPDLIQRLKNGDPDALTELYEHCRQRLICFARERLQNVQSALAEAEGVANSAFLSFIRCVQERRYKQLDDARHLWQLLLEITKRKAGKLQRWLEAEKRDWRRCQNEGPPPCANPSGNGHPPEAQDREPPPDVKVELAEECSRLLRLLADETLEKVATYKWEGFTNEEIAEMLGCVVATVERKLKRIRDIWRQQGVAP